MKKLKSILPFFPLILFFDIILSPLQAMIKEKEETAQRQTPQHIHIVSPQGVDILRKLQVIVSAHPKIIQPFPQIDSKNDFRAAKEYLTLSKKYDDILNGAAVSGAKRELVDESVRVLKRLRVLINALQKAYGCEFASEDEEKELENDSNEIDYRIGRGQLMLLVATLLTPSSRNNSEGAIGYVQEIKRIKEIISRSPEHRKKLQEEIEKSQEFVPILKTLFHPEMSLKLQQSPRKSLKKIEKQKNINFHQRITNCISQSVPEEKRKENFDTYFHFTVHTIFTEALTLSTKKISSDEYIRRLQKLTEDYTDLEKEGAQFKASLSQLEKTSQSTSLNCEDLAALYQFFCKRYALPQKNPLQLLENSIFMFIHISKLEEALIRTETLRKILLEQGSLSDSFISFRASVLALNGNTDEWRGILEERKKAAEKEKSHLHQQNVHRITIHLGNNREQQNSIENKQEVKDPKKEIHFNQNKEKSKETDFPVSSTSYIPLPSNEELKYEIIIPLERVKTRKPAQPPTSKDKLQKPNKNLTYEPASTSIELLKDYPVSKNAFKTYAKIREGNSKFSRMDLYNLFEKLGCTVDISQGKGDHGRIFFPLNMTVTNKEELVAVIPEFIQQEAFANAALPLTIPNWDEKWDGRVPPYMMKSILNALDYLGATDKTVHK